MSRTLKLLDASGKPIKLNITKGIETKVKRFKQLWSINGYDSSSDKFLSMVWSETFSSLYTEGEISSRRLIRSGKPNDENVDTANIRNFIEAFKFVNNNSDISINNLFTVYSLLTKGLDLGDSKLKDGEMFRHDDVFIGSNSMNGQYKGLSPKMIKPALESLISFIKDDESDIVIKSIVAHMYFEIIHPYFDYNGRTGRFLPMWIGLVNGTDCLRYFATSVGNFREQYLALFSKSIDIRTKEVNLERFIEGVLDLLILNQHQYSFINNWKEEYIDDMGKVLNDNQKNILQYIMIKYEKQSKASSWIKLSQDATDFIERDIKQPQLHRDLSGLIESGLLSKTDTRPVRYKLNGYKLYK